MPRISRWKAAWVWAAWLGAVGLVGADSPRPKLGDRVIQTPVGAESAPPPLAIEAPSILSVDSPKVARPTKVEVLVPVQATDPKKDAAPQPKPIPPIEPKKEAPKPVEPKKVAPPIYVPATPGTHQPVDPKAAEPKPTETAPANCATCENPWAKVPTPAIFPRLGLFLVPPTGPGYYSFKDFLHGNCREKPPAVPYPPFFLQPLGNFDNDFRYLDKPDNTQTDLFDGLKRQHPTPDTMLTVGGQHSLRFMNEVDSRLGRVDNSYILLRNRVYADFWYRDSFRVYAEFIHAGINGNELPALPIDENRGDLLNLFIDAKLTDIGTAPLYLRAGRQELIFGSQRLVSTLDWANTRREFEGFRVFRHGEKFDADAFWVRPVPINAGNFDSPNRDQQFYGAWFTYRPEKGQFFDLYYLGLSDDTMTPDRYVRGPRAVRGNQETHTFGARAAGNRGPILYDFEGMWQCGTYLNRDHQAYAYTAELGYVFENVPCKPQIWGGFDYASGTANPGAGGDRTFNQLYAFGHYYLGFADIVGRQNIQDLHAQVAFYPQNWITVVAQYHNFRLAERRDFLYNAAGRPTRRSANGAAGRDVGDEVDVLLNFHLSQHQDVGIGYSKLFAGDFVGRTGPNVSPELFYVQYNFRW